MCRQLGPGFDRPGRFGSREDASRIVSRLIDFGTITLIACLAAFGLAQLVGSVLIEPMERVAGTLAGQSR